MKELLWNREWDKVIEIIAYYDVVMRSIDFIEGILNYQNFAQIPACWFNHYSIISQI